MRLLCPLPLALALAACCSAAPGGTATSGEASGTGGGLGGSSGASSAASASSGGCAHGHCSSTGASSTGTASGSSTAGIGSSTGGASSSGGNCTPFGCANGTSAGASTSGGASSAGTNSGGSSTAGGSSTGGLASCTNPTGIQRLYGNGGAAQDSNWASIPLAVLVEGCAGQTATVTWQVTQGTGEVSPDLSSGPATTITTQTDATGTATAAFRYPSTFAQQSETSEPGTVVASVGALSVSFTETTFSVGSSLFQETFALNQPAPGNPLFPDGGVAGQTYPGAVQISVFNPQTGAQSNQPAPNVGLRLTDPNDPTQPGVVQCQGDGVEGAVLTDSSGVASCNVVVGTTPGVYQLRVEVGEVHSWPVSVTIVP